MGKGSLVFMQEDSTFLSIYFSIILPDLRTIALLTAVKFSQRSLTQLVSLEAEDAFFLPALTKG